MYREPSGKRQRPSAEERADKVRQVALEARGRLFGLDGSQVPPDIETNVLGRLRATGEVSQRQYDAGTQYRAIVRAYDRIHLIGGLPKAGDLNRGGGGIDGADPFDPDTREAHEAETARAVKRYRECEAALRQCEDRHASPTVKAVVIADWPADFFTPALRVGLNALAQSLQLPLDPPKEEAA